MVDVGNSGRRRTQDLQSKLARRDRLNLVQVLVSERALGKCSKKNARCSPASQISPDQTLAPPA
jgi:hypothetical protein